MLSASAFRLYNNVAGWAIFLVAIATYMLTLEPTASLWDCGEFIACADKLQVPHPPGAPFFLLTGRMFSFFAGGDVTKVAYWINTMSALSSAFTVLFLFWSITLLARKMVKKTTDGAYSVGEGIAILGAGAIGALALTFSDSFWFSAVEAEVYAMSIFFTAFVVWAMLKWESVADEEGADRWLLLIAYGIGLSIGVHLLNLLTIPALGFIYYFKKYKQPTLAGMLATFGIASVLLLVVQIGIIPGLPSMAMAFELSFVNTFGMGFNSGIIFFFLLLVGGLAFGIYYSTKISHRILNLCLLGLTFIIIGYSSYGIVLVRSQFNPPIDENNPEDGPRFISYLLREQYGDRPLSKGATFTAPLTAQDQGEALYRKDTVSGKYVVYDHKIENTWDPSFVMTFPRMHSHQGHHVSKYLELMAEYEGLPKDYFKDYAAYVRTYTQYKNAGYPDHEIVKAIGGKWLERKSDGSYGLKVFPTFGQNVKFLFDRQFGYFYWRYFGWNFVGRQGDVQGSGVLWPGDSFEKVPEEMDSMARNAFYGLPLLLGLLGLVFQVMKDRQNALIVALLFFMTGMAIILYLNVPPVEPRERDYAYVGSFYAFCIWIGLGVMALYDLLGKKMLAGVLALGLSGVVPAVMAAEGWDDHNRSGRYYSVDSARNLLNSCAYGAILFTAGDNDTFPIWYLQEVEGYRTDVRVCNFSLANTDWYIDQMRRQAYKSDPLPISLEPKDYMQGTNDYIQLDAKSKKAIPLDKYIELVRKGSGAVKGRDGYTILPSKTFKLSLDTDKISSLDWIPSDLRENIAPQMEWSVSGSLYKKDLLVLDLISENNKNGWTRPIYFSGTVGRQFLGLDDYVSLEGLAYRLLPVKTNGGHINTKVAFDNMVGANALGDSCQWRGLDNPNIFYDYVYVDRSLVHPKMAFLQLAQYLRQVENNKKKAQEVLKHCLTVMPDNSIHYRNFGLQFVQELYACDLTEDANELSEAIAGRTKEMMDYREAKGQSISEQQQDLTMLYRFALSQQQSELADKYKAWLGAQ